MVTVGQKGDVKINKIFRLLDRYGRIYYLCSNNDNTIYFRQYLYGWDGENMLLLCKADGVSWDRYDENYKIVFNPTQFKWDYCLPNNRIYQKVWGTVTYKLYLDWEKSVIKIEE